MLRRSGHPASISSGGPVSPGSAMTVKPGGSSDSGQQPGAQQEPRPPQEQDGWRILSYMLGGMTVYVPAEHVQEIDLPVEKVLKLCTTAHIGA